MDPDSTRPPRRRHLRHDSASAPAAPTERPDQPAALVTSAGLLTDAILDLLGRIPRSDEPARDDPHARARAIARRAAASTAATAGGLALPPGPLGWLTLLPELVVVWRLQSQMVADIAAVYGRRPSVTREQMIHCLFRHTAAQALRDVGVRVGERWLVRRVPLATLQRVARGIGVDLTRRALTRAVGRWVPVAGAVGVAAYAYFDTRQVAETAIALFGDPVATVELPVLPPPAED